MPTTPTALPAIPPFPALADRALGTYNSKAYTWATEWDTIIAPALEALADNTYDNAVEGAASAVTATTKAAEALASASTATSAPGTSGTSTTSLTLAVGSISFTTQTGKTWTPGMSGVLARTSDAGRRAIGYVSTYNSGTGAVVFIAEQVFGSGGPYTDWTFAHQGAPGIDAELTMPEWAPGVNSAVTVSRNGQMARPSASLTLTPDSAASLGDGFTMLIAPTSGTTTVAALGTVATGQVSMLYSNGTTNSLLTLSSSSPAETFESSTALAGLSTADFTFDTAFDYRLVIEGLTCTTNNSSVNGRVSVDSGATYPSGGSDYAYTLQGHYASAAGNDASTGATRLTLGQGVVAGVDSTSGGCFNGEITLTNLASTTRRKNIHYKLAWNTASNGIFSLVGDGQYIGALSAVTNFRLFPTAGTFATGVVLVFKTIRS